MDAHRAPPRRGLDLRRLTLIAVAAAALVGVGIGVLLHNSFATQRAQAKPSLPALHGQAVWRAGARPAPAFSLVDQHGRRFRLTSTRGRAVVVTFLDSLCTAECPIEARELAAAIRSVPPADRPALVVVSVDLADTPKTVAKAARKWHLPAGFEWLMGTHAELARVWRAYGIEVIPTKTGDIAHTDAFYVLDAHGDERAGFLTPFIPGLLAHDLRQLA